MANIPAFVGVPKRASCNRCSNPIFLAERISFGEKSYHRSCLKCARCGTQLTVGSFYETETDGEYCCETCPDEEIQLTQRRESSASSESSRSSVTGTAPVTPVVVGLTRNVRSSKLLDRISFFESAPLSDEEKTSNLERKSRMSSFLKGTLEDVEQKQEKPPDLPTTAPPKANDSFDEEKWRDSVAVVAEEADNDAEDEFEKLVRDLEKDDLTEEDPKRSLQSIPDDLEKQSAIDTSSITFVPLALVPSPAVNATEVTKSGETTVLSTVEDDPTELANIIVVVDTADETENVTVLQDPVTVEQSIESQDSIVVKLEDELISAIDPPNEILTNVSKNDDLITDKIIDDQKEPSLPPSTSNLVPIVIESIVPEKEEIIDSELLAEGVASSTTETLLAEERVASTDTKVLPDEVIESTAIKLLPEVLEPSPELTVLCDDPVIDGNTIESKVPVKDEVVADPHEIVTRGEIEQEYSETQPATTSSTNDDELYPSDLNPFGDGDDENGERNERVVELRKMPGAKPVPTMRRVSTNPFGSEDEDDDTPQSPSSKPPRPPPPKVKMIAVPSSNQIPANPFGEEDEEDAQAEEPDIVPVVSKPSPRRTPVPTPRRAHAYNDSVSSLDNSLMSSSRLSSSNVSLASSLESGPSSMVVQKRKKGKAPDVPVPLVGGVSPQPALSVDAEKLSNENLSNNSGSGTLTTPRKKRLAPAPPLPAVFSSTPKQEPSQTSAPVAASGTGGLTRAPSQRLLTLDASLISSEHVPSDPITRAMSNDSVVYRRTIVPLVLDEDGPESPVNGSTNATTSERQWEKMKDNKEAQNRNRQSQSSPVSEGNGSSFGTGLSILANKSSQGKWKRRKGPAPALPMIVAPLPERKPIKMLPLKEIHQELQIIETQQQGLEKQGIVLETMIRERCEGVEADVELDIRLQANSKEVEDLIMQLFELVNEKNELFRRQAELMYLRRMHRLEQEQADLEYEIRLLMAQPERNKTDSDKEKEEALIARLVEIVQLRNEVVECLEMDRIREAEEDLSIKQSIEERAASQQSKHGSSKKDSSLNSYSTLPLTDAEKRDSTTKLSKKEKKRIKEAKKLVKSKKIDSEKDADETENSTTKEKKKKRKFLF